jgi:hypothetical protein
MDVAGQRAQKLIYALLLVAITAAFGWTLRTDDRAAAQQVEAQVEERARPQIEAAIRTARDLGDEETADWLENILRIRDAQRGRETRRVAGKGF